MASIDFKTGSARSVGKRRIQKVWEVNGVFVIANDYSEARMRAGKPHAYNVRVVPAHFAMGLPVINYNGIKVIGDLALFAIEGENPSNSTITINATDDNGDALDWTLTENITWASFNPMSGNGETIVTISIDNLGAGLVPGDYSEPFTINAVGAENNPYTGTLQLTVLPVGLYILTEDNGYMLLEDGGGAQQEV
jgi:hypothetical protein